jgi:hypothetical protein
MHHALGWNFTFEHIKIHQDSSVQLADLPIKVQLNVEANQLARDFLATSEYQEHASQFPSTKCQLVIEGDTISRKVPNTIFFQAGVGPLHGYLPMHNFCTQETLDSIPGQPMAQHNLTMGATVLPHQTLPSPPPTG